MLSIYLSFSAVSRPIFASKYAFFGIFRNLQDMHTFAPLQIQHLQIFFEFFIKKTVNFPDFCIVFVNFAQIGDLSLKFSQNFVGIAGNDKDLPEIQKKLQKIAKFHENSKFGEILPILAEFSAPYLSISIYLSIADSGGKLFAPLAHYCLLINFYFKIKN